VGPLSGNQAAPRRLPVYLIHYDQPEWCAAAARSVGASTGVAVDLTVVDNGVRRARPLATLLAPGTRIIAMEENRGYTGAANRALRDWREREPHGDYCVIGSHDLHVEPDALVRLVAVADERADAGIVAPLLVGPVPAAGGYWAGWKASQYEPRAGSDVVDCEWASGTCLLLRRGCVDEVGPFDERLGSYLEDVDYGLRAKDLGWSVVVVTGSRAHGLGSGTTAAMWTMRTANTVLLNAKRAGARGAAVSFAKLARSGARGVVGGLVPGRSPSRRAHVRSVALPTARGLTQVVVDGRLIRMLLRPDDQTWSSLSACERR
jgi:hypothetical protein